MKELIYKAALYTPDVLAEFVTELYDELNIENKALFKAILVRYFLHDTLLYPDELNNKISNKK